jgi:uncharacterized protein (TIGR03382 family)
MFATAAILVPVVASFWSVPTTNDGLVCGTPAEPDSFDTYAGEEEVRILYLNRCVGGCTINPGINSAQDDSSTLVSGAPVNLPEFSYGDETWTQMMGCMQEMFAPFNVNVTDVDPGTLPHYEGVVAGSNVEIQPGAAGVAPFACAGTTNAIGFTFAETVGGNARALCETMSHEAGHLFGLEHAFLCEDPMTYLDGCGEKSFQDVESKCGTGAAVDCTCGPTQNSYRKLLGRFGPGGQPPTADVEIISISEAPGASNGDGILTPGEGALLELRISNSGNSPASGASVSFTSGALNEPDNAALPEIAPGFTVDHTVTAEVAASACGKTVEVGLTSSLSDQTASVSFTSGIEQSTVLESFDSAAGWQVDESATDTANQGVWAFGVPEDTQFINQKLQPAGGPGNPGDSVWFTGLEAGPAEQVAGDTSLTSTTMDLSAWRAVTSIRFNLWYVALDRPNRGLEPATTSHLRIEMSNDDGATWVVVDEFISDPVRWQERESLVQGFEPSATTRIRFVASNDASIDDRIVEVGLDSVTLVGGGLLCEPTSEEGGGGCSTTGIDPSLPGALLLLGFAMIFRRRRSRH